MARMKKATFRDARTLASARAARRRAQDTAPDQATTTNGCRCPVCNGRDDDPEGIHGHRGRVAATAADAYRAASVEIEALMEAIGDGLARHHAAQQASPTN